jgi:hypothetical protein
MDQVKCPRYLFETLVGILAAKGERLAKDVAKELNADPAKLLKVLNLKETARLMLIGTSDEGDEPYECQAIVHKGAVETRCRQPALGGSVKYCCAHEKYGADTALSVPMVERILTQQGAFFEADQDIWTADGVRIGQVTRGGEIMLVEFDQQA